MGVGNDGGSPVYLVIQIAITANMHHIGMLEITYSIWTKHTDTPTGKYIYNYLN